jgi:RNA polymerase-binding transcription factor DksA
LEDNYERHTQFLADISSRDMKSDLLVSRILSSRQALTEIARALQAIVDGRYGLCDGCARQIPKARLEHMPHAAYCAPCDERTARRANLATFVPRIVSRPAADRLPASRAASPPSLRPAL